MKNNNLQVWHRCGTCGTIFADLGELQSHLEKHPGSKGRTSRLDQQPQANSSDFPTRERGRDVAGRKVRPLDR